MASIFRSPPLSLPAARDSIAPSRGKTVVTSLDPGPDLPGRQQVAAHLQVLPHGQRREHVVDLRHVADPGPGDLLRRLAGHVRLADDDRARGDAHHADQALEEGGLARAVRPDEGDDLAGLGADA